MRTVWASGILLACSVTTVLAQQGSPVSVQNAFDIVSVKPEAADAGSNIPTFVGCHGTNGTDPPWRTVPTGMCQG